ncbi:hypothetical protein [Azospirillum halopraeferens]|uniref:hypothetical protein n=1 Tax=Azospirillum halopraeferens TaxID=34010 RepID=UPI0004090671|nr:hypothetical protein [Azospirillum halopraeferens]
MNDRDKEAWAQAGAESPDDVDAGNRTSESRRNERPAGGDRSPDDADADKPSGGSVDDASGKAQEDAARERARSGGYQ